MWTGSKRGLTVPDNDRRTELSTLKTELSTMTINFVVSQCLAPDPTADDAELPFTAGLLCLNPDCEGLSWWLMVQRSMENTYADQWSLPTTKQLEFRRI